MSVEKMSVNTLIISANLGKISETSKAFYPLLGLYSKK